MLSAAQSHSVGPPPADLPVESVQFAGLQGNPLFGWLIPGRAGQGGVLLLHGVRADRRSMLGRARFLHQAGYTVFLFDFQAHGESPGAQITFGYREARDARAALAYLHRRLPGEPLGAIGVSLGGAAALLGEEPLPVAALVLEAVYPTLAEAIGNRLAQRLGTLGYWLTPLFLAQIEPRLGFDPVQLTPLAGISRIQAPVLVIAGSADAYTPAAESQRLFAQAPEPKTFWLIAGAAHVDFHAYAPVEYEKRVLEFLAAAWRGEGI